MEDPRTSRGDSIWAELAEEKHEHISILLATPRDARMRSSGILYTFNKMPLGMNMLSKMRLSDPGPTLNTQLFGLSFGDRRREPQPRPQCI